MPVIAEDTIEMEFMKELNFIEVEARISTHEEIDVKEVKKELKRIDDRKERWKELYVDGDLTKKAYKEKIDDEIEKENALRRSLEITTETPTAEVINSLIINLQTKWPEISLYTRKQILSKIFDTIIIECIKSLKGGRGERPLIEIKQTTFK